MLCGQLFFILSVQFEGQRLINRSELVFPLLSTYNNSIYEVFCLLFNLYVLFVYSIHSFIHQTVHLVVHLSIHSFTN